MVSLRLRCATHEAGHATAALAFAIPIIRVSIADGNPHLHRACYRAPHDCGLERMVVLCLSRPRSGTGILRLDHRRQRPRRLSNGSRVSGTLMSPIRCKPLPNWRASVTLRRSVWCGRLGRS